jgi:hypothetical protein
VRTVFSKSPERANLAGGRVANRPARQPLTLRRPGDDKPGVGTVGADARERRLVRTRSSFGENPMALTLAPRSPSISGASMNPSPTHPQCHRLAVRGGVVVRSNTSDTGEGAAKSGTRNAFSRTSLTTTSLDVQPELREGTPQ